MAESRPESKRADKELAKKREALSFAYTQIERQYGKGAIMRLGDRGEVVLRGVSTGSLALDLALGGRGVPRGRVVKSMDRNRVARPR